MHLAIVMISSYRNVVALLRQDPELGRLGLGYFVIGVAYNFTEAAFKATDPVWFVFLLLAMAYPAVVVSRRSMSLVPSSAAGQTSTEGVIAEDLLARSWR